MALGTFLFTFAVLVTWVTSTNSPTPAPTAIPTSTPSSTPRYLFGQSAPLTGYFGRLGSNMRLGTVAAFRKINDAGGIHGHVLDLVTLDDMGVAAVAVNNTRQLIEQKVIGCVSYMGENGITDSLPLMQDYHMPLIAPYTGSRHFRVPVNRYVLHARASLDEEMHTWVSYCISRGITLFAAYYEDDESGRSGLQALQTALSNQGLNLLVSDSFTVGRNISVSGIKSVLIDPQAIVLIGDPETSANFVKVAKDQWPTALFHTAAHGPHVFLDTLRALNINATEAQRIFVTQVFPQPQPPQTLMGKTLPPTNLGHSRLLWDYAYAMNKTFPTVDSVSFSMMEGFMAGMFVGSILERMQPFNYTSYNFRPYLDNENVTASTISLDDEASLRAWRDYMVDTLFVESMVDVSGIRLGPFVPNVTCPGNAFDCIQPPSPPCTQGMQNVFLVQPEVVNRSFTELTKWRVPSSSCFIHSQSAPSDRLPLVFGQSAVLSGGSQGLGLDLRNGILAAFAEANQSPAQGVRGRKLLLVSMDDRYNDTQAVINAKALIANQSLVAVLGSVGTFPTAAVIPLYRAAGVPLIGTLSGSRLMREEGLINIRALYDDEVGAMIDLGLSLGLRKYSVLKLSDPYGDAGVEAAEFVLRYHKMQLHSVVGYKTSAALNASFQNLTALGVPEVLLMFSTYTVTAQAIELSLSDPAWAKTVFITASPSDPDRLQAKLSQAALQTGRVYSTTVVPPMGNDAFSNNYYAALKLIDPRLFVGEPYYPSFGTREGYLIGRFVITALARVTEFTGKAMLDEILSHSITVDNITMGPYTEDCNMGRRTVHIIRLEDNNTTRFTQIGTFRAHYHNTFMDDCGAYTLYNDAQFECPDGYLKEYINENTLDSECRVCLSPYGCHLPERVENSALRAAMLSLNIIGFIVAVVFTLIVWKYRQTVTIRAVSPPFCVLILLGAMCGYIFVFIQYPAVPTEEVCMAQVYILNTACCLLFGSLFAKVFRVTQIFRKPKEQSLNVLKIRDSTLFVGVGVLWCVEMIFTAVWHAASPLVPVHRSNPDEQYWTCESENSLWGIADILVNGIYLMYGVMLSFQSRRIPTVFNEAKFVAATMYNTLILGTLAILLGYALAQNNDQLYIFKAMGVFVVFTVDIGLLIASKFPSLYGEVAHGKIPQFKNDSSSGNSARDATRASVPSRPHSSGTASTTSRVEVETRSLAAQPSAAASAQQPPAAASQQPPAAASPQKSPSGAIPVD